MILEQAYDVISFHMATAEEAGGDDVTELLRDWENPESRERLVALVYPELRRMAAARLRRERSGHTLQPTALVSEVFLQLMRTGPFDCSNRQHFFAIVSEKMRRILVDHARRRSSIKRGGGAAVQTVDSDIASTADSFQQWIEIDDLFDELEKVNSRVATAFKLHYFMELTFEQVGQALRVNRKTVQRDCDFARAWLFAALYAKRVKHDEPGPSGKA